MTTVLSREQDQQTQPTQLPYPEFAPYAPPLNDGAIATVADLFPINRGRYGYDGHLWAPGQDIKNPRIWRVVGAVGTMASRLALTSNRMRDAGRPGNLFEAVYAKADAAMFNAMLGYLAGKGHDDWRYEDYAKFNPDGSFVPREKDVKDQSWIQAHGGQTKVDIAQRLSKLPHDWQAENVQAAFNALWVVDTLGAENIDTKNPGSTSYNHAGSMVHDDWLKRQERAGNKIPAGQQVAFPKLSAEEQEKDIRRIRSAQALLKDRPELASVLHRVMARYKAGYRDKRWLLPEDKPETPAA